MEKFTKIEVAINLLTRSKELFQLRDYASATVLAGAGQQIIRDVAKHRGVEPTIHTISSTSGQSVKKIHDLVVGSYNSLKHADMNPEEIVEVSEDDARVLLTLAATDLMRMKEIKSQEISDIIEFVRKIKSN